MYPDACPRRPGHPVRGRACSPWALALAALLVTATTVSAQQGRGTILGTVTDSTGVALPGVTVEVTNVATEVTTPVTTNAQGAYSAPNLLVGAYTVTFSLDGFSKTVRAGILLEVDQRAQVDVVLEVGSVSEVVEVNARASLLDTTTATLGKVVENRQIQELPLNGRNALSLVLLTPAVQSGVGPSASGFGDRGTELALIRINGSPLAANNFLVDGLSSTNPYYPDLNITPTVDAVQEFKVQTNTMSSEYGFTLGGVVNLVTKSGTNSYHGTLYEFVRNDALDANSWQNNRTDSEKAPLDYNQFGGSAGGPIRLPSWLGGVDGRGRSFFFYNFEGYEFTTSRTGFLTVPTEAMRQGDFSDLRDAEGNLITIFDPATTRPNPNGNGFIRDPFPGNVIPQGRLDPVAQNITAFYPLPNRSPDNALSRLNNYVGTVSNEREFRQHVARIDHRISDRNQLAVRYVYSRQFTDQGTSNLYPDPVIRTRNDPFRGHNVVVTDQHTFSSTLLHETRLGLAKQLFDFTVVSFGGNWPQQLGLPSSVPPDTFPQIRNGLPTFMTGTVGNRGGEVWQLADAFTWLRGNHSLKFGTQLRWTEAANFQAGAGSSGDFTFSSNLTNNASPDPTARINTGDQFATFLLGAVSSANVSTHLPEEEVGGAVGFFFNDEWRTTPRLSLSLGVRYDLQQQPSERNCGTSNFNPFATNPTNGLLGRTEFACVDFDRPFARTDTNDVAARIGVAWDVLGDQSTVVRGGYGTFYAGTFQFGLLNFESTNGFASTSTRFLPPGNNSLLPAFQLQDGLPSAPLTSQGADFGPNLFALTTNAEYREADQPTPVSHQWGLSVQRQLPGRWMVEAAYSGNRGLHLIAGNYDLNQADPALIREFGLAGELDNLVPNPFAGEVPGEFGAAEIPQEQALRPTPYVGGIPVRSPHLGSSMYHSLLLSAQKRFSDGFSLLASYTYAHFESDSVRNPINFVPTEGGGEFDFQNGRFDRDAEWSEDPSNVPHRLVVSGVWDLPIGRGRAINIDNGLLNALAGGWQLNGIGTFVSGAPLIVRGASNGLADRPDLLRDPSLPDDHVDENPERGVLFFDPTAFANPEPFTFGNAPRAISSARTPGAAIVDLSLFKTVRLAKGTAVQFRLEVFNALNHTNLGRPDLDFEAGPDGLNNSDSFGRITTARAPRQLQLAVKLMF